MRPLSREKGSEEDLIVVAESEVGNRCIADRRTPAP
jgi:hypothetical protein